MKIENGMLGFVSKNDITDGQFEIPEGVTSIDNHAFARCSNLISILISKDRISIGNFAFYKCNNLASIVISKSIVSIGERAFHDCCKLTSIVIPEGITSIGSLAFSGCSSLTSITIPNSINHMGHDTFDGCKALSVIHIDANNQESYENILALLPENLQQAIENYHQNFIEKTVVLLAGSKQSTSFFRHTNMPTDVTHKLIADLAATQYGISPFMLNLIYHKSGINAEDTPDIDDKPSFGI